MKLTKTIIENSNLPLKGQHFLWDSELKGFGVRLTPGGRAYIAQGRVNGVNRRVSLGKHGVITLHEARRKAQKELLGMFEGIDPVKEKKRNEAYSLTLREITDGYLKDRRNLKQSSRADILKHINKSFASWADRPATEITRDKVATLFGELTERSPAQANQAFRILRALLNYASGKYRPDDKPLLVENPVSILSEIKTWNKIKPRTGRIPTDKIGLAWNVLQALREAPEQTIISRTLADAVSFLLLTGARWNEAAQLTWNMPKDKNDKYIFVNLNDGWWHISDSKNRNPVTFPLSRVAIDILTARTKDDNDKYVFPARSGTGHIVDARGVMDKLSNVANIRITPHDLRRTFRAIAGECGIEFWKIKLLMGHKMSGDVTITHYTETADLRYLAPEINLIGDWIERQGVIASSDNIVSFPQKAANGGGEA